MRDGRRILEENQHDVRRTISMKYWQRSCASELGHIKGGQQLYKILHKQYFTKHLRQIWQSAVNGSSDIMSYAEIIQICD